MYFGHHDVAPGFGHLGPVLHDVAVGAELLERLVETDVTQLVEHHGDEAGVEQVQHGVLVAADVGGDREPLLRPLGVEGPVVELGAGIAQVIPG